MYFKLIIKELKEACTLLRVRTSLPELIKNEYCKNIFKNCGQNISALPHPNFKVLLSPTHNKVFIMGWRVGGGALYKILNMLI